MPASMHTGDWRRAPSPACALSASSTRRATDIALATGSLPQPRPSHATTALTQRRAAAFSLRRSSWSVVALCTAAALLLAACLKPAGVRYPELPTQQNGALHVIAFDVGQSDAMLLLHKNRSMLIDAGSTIYEPHRVANRVPRRLEALTGSRQLDYMVVTHYHADHFGRPGGDRRGVSRPTGLYALMEQEGITVETMVDRGFWNLHGDKGSTQRKYETYVQRWMQQGLVQKRRQVYPGDTLDMGPGLRVEVVTAMGNGQIDRLAAMFPSMMEEYAPTENDYSIGLKIEKGDFEMFTAGDLSGTNQLRRYGPIRQSYNDMESRIADDLGALEVYRVNHHGSAFSSNPCFVEVLHPLVSIISSGENTYGHPDPQVYTRLKSYGDVWITGGADPRVRDQLAAADIVGGDVEVLVAPDGEEFWVNGEAYPTLSDAEEAARPNARASCEDTLDSTRQQPQQETLDIKGAPD